MLGVGDHGDGLGLQGPRLLVGVHLDAEDRALGVDQQVDDASPQAQTGLDLASGEQDLGLHAQAVGVRADRIVGPGRRRLLQPVLRLVDGAQLQVGQDHPPPEPDHLRPDPQPLQHRQGRAQVVLASAPRSTCRHSSATRQWASAHSHGTCWSSTASSDRWAAFIAPPGSPSFSEK